MAWRRAAVAAAHRHDGGGEEHQFLLSFTWFNAAGAPRTV
jgi:hypothetical protein